MFPEFLILLGIYSIWTIGLIIVANIILRIPWTKRILDKLFPEE